MHGHQFAHNGKHVVFAFIDEDFGVVVVWFADAYISIVDVIDAVPGPEVTADFDGIMSHLAGNAAIKGDAVSRTVHDFDQVLPALDRSHDLTRAATDSDGRVIRMQGEPDVRVLGDRYYCFQEVRDVTPHLIEVVDSFLR